MAEGNYEHMRHMHIRVPKRPAPAKEIREIQECGDCCVCPRHGELAA